MEVFKIVKSIVNAYHDSKNLNIDDYFTDILPNIGMYLGIAYRKSGEAIKHQIVNWMDELEKQNYYENYYLEDIIKKVRICL